MLIAAALLTLSFCSMPILALANTHSDSIPLNTIAATPTSIDKTCSGKISTSTAATTPSPTQSGVISTCNAWYDARKGDTCDSIVTEYACDGLTLTEFYKWNPAVGDTCKSLWVGYWVCVGSSATHSSTTTKTTPTTIKTTPTTIKATPSTTKPSPLMPSTIATCKSYYLVKTGDDCTKVESKFDITAAQFKKWNPFVNALCTNLWLGYYVCVWASDRL